MQPDDVEKCHCLGELPPATAKIVLDQSCRNTSISKSKLFGERHIPLKHRCGTRNLNDPGDEEDICYCEEKLHQGVGKLKEI